MNEKFNKIEEIDNREALRKAIERKVGENDFNTKLKELLKKHG